MLTATFTFLPENIAAYAGDPELMADIRLYSRHAMAKVMASWHAAMPEKTMDSLAMQAVCFNAMHEAAEQFQEEAELGGIPKAQQREIGRALFAALAQPAWDKLTGDIAAMDPAQLAAERQKHEHHFMMAHYRVNENLKGTIRKYCRHELARSLLECRFAEPPQPLDLSAAESMRLGAALQAADKFPW